MVLPSGLFPLDFTVLNLHAPLLSPIRATFPANFIIFDLISRILFDEE